MLTPTPPHTPTPQAFDVLERLDPNPEFWDAKRGAAVGVFQMIIAGKEQVRPGVGRGGVCRKGLGLLVQ